MEEGQQRAAREKAVFREAALKRKTRMPLLQRKKQEALSEDSASGEAESQDEYSCS